jgi:hypothetical protein
LFVNFPINPGVFTDDTELSAKGYFVDADKVRFERGKPQTIGGWEIATNNLVTGICRGLFTWKNSIAQAWAELGTHVGTWAYFDGVLYENTPIIERGELTNPFDTTDTDETVTVNDTAHGLVVDQRVYFANASAVGGITPDGWYPVATVPDANSYTIEHSSAATSSVSGGGGTVDFEYGLAPGLQISTGGAGYGTGGYGVGGYGGDTTIAYYARTWAFAPWGSNVLGVPRGGGLYEWATNTTATEEVTNGAFAADTDWTKGANWTIGSGVATAATASTALEQNISIDEGTWYLLDMDVTLSSGTVTASWNGVDIGAAISAAATIKRVFYSINGGTAALAFTGASFVGTLDNVSVKPLLTMQAVTNAPTQNTVMTVTEEMIVMCAGTIDVETGVFDPRHVRWSDTGVGLWSGNQSWTPSPSNLSGAFTLTSGGEIIGIERGKGEVLIWTESSLYVARYTGNPDSAYNFTEVGTGCGLVGPNACAMANGVAFWMAPNGHFFMWDGTSPRPVESPLRRTVFDNLAKVQGNSVYATHIAAFNEIWWLYPDGRDGNEVSRYVSFDYTENVWSLGTFDRTAWEDAAEIAYPISVDTAGQMRFQEKGNSADGGVLTYSVKTGALDLKDGAEWMQIMGFIPDFDSLVGGLSIVVKTYAYPNSTPETNTYTINNQTGRIDMRASGRQMTLEFIGNSAPGFMRMGVIRADLQSTQATR